MSVGASPAAEPPLCFLADVRLQRPLPPKARPVLGAVMRLSARPEKHTLQPLRTSAIQVASHSCITNDGAVLPLACTEVTVLGCWNCANANKRAALPSPLDDTPFTGATPGWTTHWAQPLPPKLSSPRNSAPPPPIAIQRRRGFLRAISGRVTPPAGARAGVVCVSGGGATLPAAPSFNTGTLFQLKFILLWGGGAGA